MQHGVILKFGGAAVATPELISHCATIVHERRQRHAWVAVVVSAMGSTTDELIHLAHQVHPKPPQRELDMLISVGERTTGALLAMALQRLNVPAVSYTGSQSGIITDASHSDARILDIRPVRLKETLKRGEVAVVSGFQGVSLDKEITTLGRGGSDTTAVALAVALGASHVEFFKDVDGIYEADPRVDPQAQRLRQVQLADVSELVECSDHAILHPRCLKLASLMAIPLHIYPFASPACWQEPGTVILAPRRHADLEPQYETKGVPHAIESQPTGSQHNTTA